MSNRLDHVENALAELIREKYPEGALWFLEGRGSLITRRGLIELSRDVLARTVKETDE
nr:MAG TPA: hypothetical protein [Caudoviricetes sp.]